MTKIVEKPKEPISRRANIGLYYLRDWVSLYEGIDWTLQQPKNKGEYFLTDAFQFMIEHGKKIRAADVGGWYDCGKVDTILETQRHLLLHGRARVPRGLGHVKIVDPVRIEDGARFEGACTIGPNVTVGQGTRLANCIVANAVIGDKVNLSGCRVRGSMIGDGVERSKEQLDNVVVAGDETAPAK
jgi:glucose-1-phosphate thymidylyltransferase